MESHLDCLSGKKERVGFNLLVWCVCVCVCVCVCMCMCVLPSLPIEKPLPNSAER